MTFLAIALGVSSAGIHLAKGLTMTDRTHLLARAAQLISEAGKRNYLPPSELYVGRQTGTDTRQALLAAATYLFDKAHRPPRAPRKRVSPFMRERGF